MARRIPLRAADGVPISIRKHGQARCRRAVGSLGSRRLCRRESHRRGSGNTGQRPALFGLCSFLSSWRRRAPGQRQIGRSPSAGRCRTWGSRHSRDPGLGSSRPACPRPQLHRHRCRPPATGAAARTSRRLFPGPGRTRQHRAYRPAHGRADRDAPGQYSALLSIGTVPWCDRCRRRGAIDACEPRDGHLDNRRSARPATIDAGPCIYRSRKGGQ